MHIHIHVYIQAHTIIYNLVLISVGSGDLRLLLLSSLLSQFANHSQDPFRIISFHLKMCLLPWKYACPHVTWIHRTACHRSGEKKRKVVVRNLGMCLRPPRGAQTAAQRLIKSSKKFAAPGKTFDIAYQSMELAKRSHKYSQDISRSWSKTIGMDGDNHTCWSDIFGKVWHLVISAGSHKPCARESRCLQAVRPSFWHQASIFFKVYENTTKHCPTLPANKAIARHRLNRLMWIDVLSITVASVTSHASTKGRSKWGNSPAFCRCVPSSGLW